MVLKYLLFHIQNLNQPIRSHGMVISALSPFLDPMRQNLKTLTTSNPCFIVLQILSRINLWKSSWNALKTDNNNKTFYIKITEKFIKNTIVNKFNKKHDKTLIPQPVNFSNLPPPPPVPSRLSKEELNKSKFHGENSKLQQNYSSKKDGQSYTQTLIGSIKDILKLK